LKWLYNHFARKKVFYPFHSLHESKWRKVTDKEMLMVRTKNADSAFGEQPNNK